MLLIDEDTGMVDRTPWHVWVVGGLAVLWNAIGAVDYVMTQTRNVAYLSGFSQEQLDFFSSMPLWAEATWAIAIWTSVIASLLILFRSRFAAPLFLLSLASMLISFFHNIVLANGIAIMGGGFYLAFTGLIVVIGVALAWYTRRMKQRGALR